MDKMRMEFYRRFGAICTPERARMWQAYQHAYRAGMERAVEICREIGKEFPGTTSSSEFCAAAIEKEMDTVLTVEGHDNWSQRKFREAMGE